MCRVHGGAAPQVKERAHEVLLADLIGPALMTLRDPIQSPDTRPAVRLRVAESILDRTGCREGMPHPSAVQVGQWLAVVWFVLAVVALLWGGSRICTTFSTLECWLVSEPHVKAGWLISPSWICR